MHFHEWKNNQVFKGGKTFLTALFKSQLSELDLRQTHNFSPQIFWNTWMVHRLENNCLDVPHRALKSRNWAIAV